MVEEQEFAESKNNAAGKNNAQGNTAAGQQSGNQGVSVDADGFMNIPDGIEEELPFS